MDLLFMLPDTSQCTRVPHRLILNMALCTYVKGVAAARWLYCSKFSEACVSCCGKQWREHFLTGTVVTGQKEAITLVHLQLHNLLRAFLAVYLVVDVVSAHGNRVHDELPAVVVVRSTEGDVIGVVLRAEVVAQFVSGHQIGLLWATGQHAHYGL